MKDLQLLLMQDVPKLGRKGEIVKVKKGYGRNYLIPMGMANFATEDNLRQIEIWKRQQKQLELARRDEMKRLAKELEVSMCEIAAKANEDNTLFGSVTYNKIAESFRKMGFAVDANIFQLEDETKYPIKELGIFPLQIQLHPEVVVKSKVWIINETQD